TTLGTGTLDGSGQTTLTTSSLSVASHSITAAYGGSGIYSSSTSATLTQTVNKSPTSTGLASSVNPSLFGQQVIITAAFTATAPGSGKPTGTVTFKDGTTALATNNLSAGQATFTNSAFSVAA